MYYQTNWHERKFDQRKGCHQLGLKLRQLRGVERQSGRIYNPTYIYSSLNCSGTVRTQNWHNPDLADDTGQTDVPQRSDRWGVL
jgi:hypothetical protein